MIPADWEFPSPVLKSRLSLQSRPRSCCWEPGYYQLSVPCGGSLWDDTYDLAGREVSYGAALAVPFLLVRTASLRYRKDVLVDHRLDSNLQKHVDNAGRVPHTSEACVEATATYPLAAQRPAHAFKTTAARCTPVAHLPTLLPPSAYVHAPAASHHQCAARCARVRSGNRSPACDGTGTTSAQRT